MTPPIFTKGQKVWVTEKCLSHGVRTATFIRRCNFMSSLGEVVIDGDAPERFQSVWYKNIHRTHEAAVIAAEAARQKRIKSLQKQIEKVTRAHLYDNA